MPLPKYEGDYCCCSLRSWSLFVGWFFTVLSLIGAGVLTWLSTYLSLPDYRSDSSVLAEIILCLYIVISIFTIFLCIFSFLLIQGIYKENRNFMLPWLTLIITCLITYAVLECFNFAVMIFPNARKPLNINYDQLVFVFVAFCFLIVQSYYQEMKERNHMQEINFYDP